MQSIKKYILVLCAAAALGLTCCGEEEKLPAGEIEDSKGLKLQLEWTTGGSATAALNEADLDLVLYKGDIEVDQSKRSSSFEEVELSGLLADGEYRASIKIYSAEKKADFELFVVGQNSETSLEYTGSFTVSDASIKAEYPDFVKITKKGTRYTIVK